MSGEARCGDDDREVQRTVGGQEAGGGSPGDARRLEAQDRVHPHAAAAAPQPEVRPTRRRGRSVALLTMAGCTTVN